MISPNLARSRFEGRVRDDLCVVDQEETILELVGDFYYQVGGRLVSRRRCGRVGQKLGSLDQEPKDDRPLAKESWGGDP